MNNYEYDYMQLLQRVRFNGDIKENRTGVDTWCMFNQNMTIDLSEGFPILTGKKMFFDKAYHEYMWIREGLVTTKYLKEHGIHWWDEYANDEGYLGKTYGYQLRSFNGYVDQLEQIHKAIRMNSRRAHATYWNPSELESTNLPPCYTGMTFMRVNNKLNMSVQLRSSDLFLGLPYDVMVMAFFLIDVAEFNELTPDKLGIQITDAHIYRNHEQQVSEYISQTIYNLPMLIKTIRGGYVIPDYEHGPYIEAPLNN